MIESAAGARRSDRLIAWASLSALLGLSAAPVAAIFVAALGNARSGGISLLASALRELGSPRSLRAIEFTLAQAGASALAALALGLPGAWIVARYEFPGRRALGALAAVPFSIPPLLVVLSFVLYYGRAGYLNRLIEGAFGLDEPPLTFLYGFWGIVLVHGFYNFPIVLQTVGAVWSRLPEDRADAARLLGAGRFRAFATGVLPSLLPSIVHATGLAFLFCFFSFAIVLVFGGLVGSTLEVEVYRRARIEGDPAGAATIALVETLIAVVVVSVAGLAGARATGARKAGGVQARIRPRGRAAAAVIGYCLLVAIFFIGPIAALAVEAFAAPIAPGGGRSFGFQNFARLAGGATLVRSLWHSLSTAIPAAAAASVLGGLIALGLRRGSLSGSSLSSAPLAVSGIVASLGWSIMVPGGGTLLVAPVLSVISLPFVVKTVSGALASLDPAPFAAARTLGASRWRASLDIELPSASPALFAAAAFSFSIAAGDLNAPLVLGRGDFEPLPILLYRLASGYRFSEAAAAGLVLGLITGLVFFAKEGKDRA